MNKYRILTAALSSKATVDDFTFCRSSDLFRLRRLPGFHQWLRLSIPHVSVSGQELTAAGTVADFHGIPF